MVLSFALLWGQAQVLSAPQSRRDQALILFRQAQYDRAAALLREQVEENGAQAKTEDLLLLAQCYYVPGKFKEALPWLERAANAGVRTSELSYMLGNGYIQIHQADKARNALAVLFGVRPESAPAYLLLAQFMLRQEFDEDAARQLQIALQKDERIPEAHYLLGEIATFRGRTADAIRELQQEIALNPNFANAYYKLGDALSRQEEWAAAIPNLQRSIWLNPTYSGPFILLGKAYWKRGDLSNAEGTLRRALTLDPRNSSAHYILGQTLVQMGRTEDGRKELELSRTPQH